MFWQAIADTDTLSAIRLTLLVTLLSIPLNLVFGIAAAWAIARFRFPGRQAGMMSFLVSQMFPGTLMLIPLYIILVKWLNLGSTRTGLVLAYSTTAIPFCVWMLKGYFDTIPRDLEEAALIDGASSATIFCCAGVSLSQLFLLTTCTIEL